MTQVYDTVESDLAGKEFICGSFSIADIVLFPHFTGVKALEVEFLASEYPNIARWFKRMRRLPVCAGDVRRARDYYHDLKNLDLELHRIFWRGDRIGWMLAHGFHDWFMNEIIEDRVLWPGAALPKPMAS